MAAGFTSRSLILPGWALLCWVSVLCQVGPERQLSEKDVMLLEEDENPKCFTRTETDFTCFWEDTSNKSYEFYYKNDGREKRCAVVVRRTEAGRVLHSCDFPPSDVLLFVHTDIRVTESSSNSTLYTRRVAIEDQVLPAPPGEVSLQHTDQAGQLQVIWLQPKDRGQYEIHVSSSSGSERTDQVQLGSSSQHKLSSLPPGEMIRVQMRVRILDYTSTPIGHWSDWTQTVTAMVPQAAEEIYLFCHTSDFQNVTCQWKSGRDSTYTLFHKTHPRGDLNESWSECPREQNSAASFCRFHGDESAAMLVKLSAGTGPLNRTFYTKTFTMSSSVKTAPPGNLRGEAEGDRLHLRWDTPQPVLSAHLMYQVRYQTRGEASWKLITLPDSDTDTSLDVLTGSEYRVQVRASPNGSLYSGYWSDWSPCLSVVVASRLTVLLLPSLSLAMIVISLVFISVFSRYLSKLKQYLWPPVPNLDKVLQSFLTEINKQTWDPSYNAKQFFEDTPASVVEILSEREAPDVKPPGESVSLLPAERDSGSGEQTEPTLGMTWQLSLDYVVLNTDDVVDCCPGNEYMHEGVGCVRVGMGMGEEEDHQCRYHCTCPIRFTSLPSTSSSPSSSPSSPSSSATTDLVNLSYLHMAEFQWTLAHQGSRASRNIYANLEREVDN